MKKILAVLVLVLVGMASYAQWNTGTGGIYYSGGNVGVNITAPLDCFHGYSAAGRAGLRLTSDYTGSTLKTLGQFMAQANNGDQFIMAFRHHPDGYQDMLQSCYLATATPPRYAEFLYFRFDNQTFEIHDGVANIAFKNTGTVAIGMGTKSVPSGALVAIGGKVVAKEIEVTLTGMPPDFVFGKDYKLASLYDVENFINANNHLPGVPSATEMTSKGVNVGDMNMTLLQKVEELTLYMINLQKENDALKARVANLEK